ncbi:protein MCM10 homolog [Spea bombifrons]|uniref:protein MCM10 homolog n=1 Tax=Spea bombifrons TaxID=233779 RepID=UPI00234A81E1|nr:protein MCM10 homolog [Spea bombifrons]
MEDDADLDLLTSLLEENEAAERSSAEHAGQPSISSDEYDELFDGDEDGSYHESDNAAEGQDVGEVKEDFLTLFGDIDDLDEQSSNEPLSKSDHHLSATSHEKSKQELEDELRKMQERMQRLQEQLQQTALAKTPNADLPKKSPRDHMRTCGKPATKVRSSPLMERNPKTVQESSCFAAQLSSPPASKSQETLKRKLSSSVNKTPPQKRSPTTHQPEKSIAKPSPSTGTPGKLPVSPQISIEKFSGLRLRRPRVSSVEMERKMNGRKLIRLSQLQSKIAAGKLEDEDWVTFGVVLKKITPQSTNNGKTFSIWRLNDLKSLDSHISLFLFGDVHKEHWKTDQGTVIGILNANPMKPKEGSDEICISVDNPQKILLLGEAMDLGTCKARKKNGDPCTQMVNLNDCEFCQYHVQAQYKKVSAKRADLQSSYSGHVPKKTARGGNGLRERLCHSGFHYGGVSSMAYGASLATAAAPKKTVQTTLSNMVVKGAAAIALEARQKVAAALQSSDELKQLMSTPTPGALNLKKHLSNIKVQGNITNQGPSVQSISAAELLKRQKQMLLDARKKRAEEIQKRFLDSSDKSEQLGTVTTIGATALQSPKPAAVFPNEQKMTTPKLGRGFAEGDDVLFFDASPPSAPKLSVSAEAKKLLAIRKLQAKGQTLTKVDPNGIKRKHASSTDVEQVVKRVDKHLLSPEAPDELEPAMKKRREQLAYMESEEFQNILKARSKHTGVLKEAEAEIQEKYFEPLVKKEQLEDKMRSIKEQKCRVVTCKTCKFTHYKLLDTCVSENHDFHWHDAVKRFFKCACGNRTISLDRLPKKNCSNCGLFKWERDGMLKEKRGPKIGGETLLPRGEEHAKFLNSLK